MTEAQRPCLEGALHVSGGPLCSLDAALVEHMREVVAAGDLATYGRLATGFHEALVEAGGNRLLSGMYAQIRARLRRYQTAMARVPHLPETSIAEHGAIVAAIASGDPPRASALAIAHLDSLVAQLPLPEPDAEDAPASIAIRGRKRG